MFATQYYCLVASLKEYALDADTKGFDARAIVSGILEEVNRGDAREVRLLYGYQTIILGRKHALRLEQQK